MGEVLKLFSLLWNPQIFAKLISMYSRGYLNEIGWFNSYRDKAPVDSENKPLPWVTYAFIDFISERLNDSMNIFEYGSGNSTLWYADKVKSVTSVEHDKNWFEKIKNKMPDNVSIFYQELVLGGEYSKFSNNSDKKFEIIIIDGRDRVNCMKNAIHSISDDGIIIVDDSNRERYCDGINFLINKNFKKIDFWGISPGLFYKKNTSIFYKTNNCIRI